VICLYRNWGKEKTWTKLSEKLGLSISDKQKQKWKRKISREEEKNKKRKTLDFQKQELAKKRAKTLRRIEETKRSAQIYQYSKTSSLENSTVEKIKNCGCTSGCITKRCGCMKADKGCIGCKCQNCQNPLNK